MNTQNFKAAGALVTLLLLTACGSSGGGLGDIFGGGGQSSDTYANEIRGRVEYVDTRERSVTLTNVRDYNSNLNPGNTGGNTVRVYFDERTPVEYGGRNYNVADLERGDEIAVSVDQSGNQLYARSMRVLYDSRGMTSGSGTNTGTNTGTYGSNVRGTVRYVDTNRREIGVDRQYGGDTIVVQYDANTYVSFNNQRYRPEDLERGDEIDIRVTDYGSGRVLAQDVNVIRSVSGTSGSGSGIYGSGTTNSRLATVRGTVRYVDPQRRILELDQTSWMTRFDNGSGSTGNVVLQYDANARVEFQNQMHPLTNLERGDVVDAYIRDDGGSRYWVERIVLVRDVNNR